MMGLRRVTLVCTVTEKGSPPGVVSVMQKCGCVKFLFYPFALSYVHL